ncbi:diguanylate cyclase, partial [Shewanella sp. SG44-6]|uniref:ligand-binding sensor domain-containing protein n=1 Tax=Shewanella sp. SG44-6 TaxID=2760959 RepID=UPI001814FFE2
MPKILLFICVYFIFSFGATAIEADKTESNFDLLLNYTNYGVVDGLSQDTVTAIVEDNEGYVWVGTINGLNRFDGNEFKQFYADGGKGELPSSFIRNLLIDDNGILLVGTDKGFVQFDKESESFTKNSISTFIGEQAIWSISKQDGEIFIGLNKEFISYDNTSLNIMSSLKNEKIKEVKKVIKFKNNFYIRNYEGSVFEKQNKTGLIIKIMDQSNDLSLIDDQIIMANEDGLYLYDKVLKKISNLNLTSIDSDTDGNIAIRENNILNIDFLDGEIMTSPIGSINIDAKKLKK